MTVVTTTIRAEVRMRARPTSTRSRIRVSARVASARRPSNGPSSRTSITAALARAATTRSAEGCFNSSPSRCNASTNDMRSRLRANRPKLGPDYLGGQFGAGLQSLLQAGGSGHVVADHLGPAGDGVGAFDVGHLGPAGTQITRDQQRDDGDPKGRHRPTGDEVHKHSHNERPPWQRLAPRLGWSRRQTPWPPREEADCPECR